MSLIPSPRAALVSPRPGMYRPLPHTPSPPLPQRSLDASIQDIARQKMVPAPPLLPPLRHPCTPPPMPVPKEHSPKNKGHDPHPPVTTPPVRHFTRTRGSYVSPNEKIPSWKCLTAAFRRPIKYAFQVILDDICKDENTSYPTKQAIQNGTLLDFYTLCYGLFNGKGEKKWCLVVKIPEPSVMTNGEMQNLLSKITQLKPFNYELNFLHFESDTFAKEDLMSTDYPTYEDGKEIRQQLVTFLAKIASNQPEIDLKSLPRFDVESKCELKIVGFFWPQGGSREAPHAESKEP